ncbi:potassium efflux system protein [Rhodovulum iodosum]|uniref:Potassium efflux system protein n=1 Tax=Rhodovulum iodosum TaxID=68291 RepID=A0ABV3XUS8_9RHOB|nr:DUF3772 domain-containing protein [Rhodovulum robiginosum]RSK32014.1 mechanosensitive ion channel family protein [Rhodovulum robiginosum]
MTVFVRLLLVLSLALASLGPVLSPAPAVAQEAQTEDALDYEAWEKTATRAEDVLQTGRASNAAMEALRQEIADWRAKFLAAQDVNSNRIQTLQTQIESLGPAPAEGESEANEIAQRRAELNRQLSELQAPVRKAEEAYSRADGLIREIDVLIRERQANELLLLGPSPLNPVHWPEAGRQTARSFSAIWGEISTNWESPARRTVMRENLPATLFYLALAGVLVLRGRRWTQNLTSRIVNSGKGRGRVVYASLSSIAQIIVPVVGLFILVAAAKSTGMMAPRGLKLVELIPVMGLVVFVGRWLGGRVFSLTEVSRPILNLSKEQMAAGRFYSSSLGLLLGIALLGASFAQSEDFSDATRAVLSFPLIVVGGLLLWRVGRLLRSHVEAEDASTEERHYRNRIIGLISRAVVVVAVVGPVLAAIGYVEAAEFLVHPTIMTLALLGLLMILQRFVYDVYDLLTGAPTGDGATEGLIPVLVGMVLAFLAMPVLALIWGARVADLTEVWARFIEGFTIGETRVSPTDFLTFALVFAVGYTLTRVVQGTLRSTVLPKTKIDPGGQTAIISGLGYVGIFLAAIIAITTAGIDLSSVALVAGALTVGIGFGLQTIVSNFVSGIILLIERPVSQGDWIEVGGVMGTVKDISVRATRIETFDRTNVIVPNADLVSGQVTNWTKYNLMGRVIVPVGVAYGTDTKKVDEILREVARAHPLVVMNPEPLILFMNFGADALEFEVRVILSNVNYSLSVRNDLNHEIARRFAEEGIEIPFAQRDIWLRNPETLSGPRPVSETIAPAPETGAPAPAATSQPEEYVPRIDNDGTDGTDGGDGDGR